MAVNSRRVAIRRLANLVFLGFCVAVTAIALTSLSLILFSLLKEGLGGVNLDLFTKSTPAAGTPGGLLNAIVGSLMMSGMGMVLALLIGIFAGTWLAEYAGQSHYGTVIRFLNDVLLSAPSILVGLFVYEILVAPFKGYSGFAGAVALALLAAPVITRTTEDVLKLQPISLRESGMALGSPMWRVIRDIVWRGGTSGILTGALLAFARISGETAPLLFTALNNQFFSWNMAAPMANLPVVIFDDVLTTADDLKRLAWAGALLISTTVLLVTLIARAFAKEQKRT